MHTGTNDQGGQGFVDENVPSKHQAQQYLETGGRYLSLGILCLEYRLDMEEKQSARDKTECLLADSALLSTSRRVETPVAILAFQKIDRAGIHAPLLVFRHLQVRLNHVHRIFGCVNLAGNVALKVCQI